MPTKQSSRSLVNRAKDSLAMLFASPAPVKQHAKPKARPNTKSSVNLKADPIGSPPAPAPLKGETAWASDTFFGNRGNPFEAWNPDILIRNKGADIYERMLRDDQVKAAYQFVVGTVVARSWTFELPENDDSEKQQAVMDFFIFTLSKALRGTPQQLFKNVLSSKATGASVTEMVFGPVTWQGQERWTLRAAKLKPFHTFRWKIDPFGNIVDLLQFQGSSETKLDPRKFIIHVTNPHVDPVFGESDLRAAYRPYWEKDNILKFWNIYLERMAGGFAVVTQKGPLQPSEKTALQNVLSNLSAQNGIILPGTSEMEVINPGATDAFERAVAQRDTAIARALLMPALLGLVPEQATGARAQSETQQDSFLMIMGMEGDQLADTLNEQLFRPLAFWNFGLEDFPRLRFDPFTEAQKRAVVEAWRTATEKGIVHNLEQDEARTRDLLGYQPLPDDFDWENAEQKRADANRPIAPVVPNPDDERQDRREARANMSEPLPGTALGAPAWRLRFDGKDAESRLDAAESGMTANMGAATDSIVAAVKEAMGEAANKAGENPDFETLAARVDGAVTPPLARALNAAVRDGLQEGYDQGRATAILEINRASEGAPLALAEKLRIGAAVSRKVASKDGCSPYYFQLGLGVQAAERYLQAKAFEITGVLTDAIKAKAKEVLLNGIKNEKSIGDMVKELEAVLVDLIGQVDAAGRQINVPARLQTIARTNLSDAFNQARLSVFTDPSIGDFVRAYLYDAIIDPVTTEFCRKTDGRIYLASDPIWKSITPPNHFNCRSVLSPITALDQGWSVSPALPDSVQPAKGFA